MSTLRVNNLTAVGGTGTITVPTGNQVVQTGAILQVVSTTKTDSFSTTSTSMTDITGMTASITPISASSKILCRFFSVTSSSGNFPVSFNLLRGSTAIGLGYGGTTMDVYNANIMPDLHHFSFEFLDSPSTTSSTTYKIQMKVTSGTAYANRRHSAADYGGISTLTLLEVAG
jgi:hypothetical protein